MLITKISKKRTRNASFMIHVDGAPAFEISGDIFQKVRLEVGEEISEKSIESLLASEALSSATRIAIDFVSYRPRSSGEIKSKLTRKGFSLQVAKKVIDKLNDLKMVNDLEFAQMYVRDQLKRRPIGRALLRKYLQAKGIVPDHIDQVLRETLTDEDQTDAATRAARKHLRVSSNRYSKLSSPLQKKRLHDYLMKRGFSHEIAKEVVLSVIG